MPIVGANILLNVRISYLVKEYITDYVSISTFTGIHQHALVLV